MLRRRRLLLNTILVLLFLGCVVTALGWMVLREPRWYKETAIASGPEREMLSRETLTGWFSILDTFAKESQWGAEFTAPQLNAYFQQDFLNMGGDDNLPPGFSSPRVKIEDGRIHVGVQYQNGFAKTTLSVELKVWLVASETNLLALEIVSLRAGSLPLSPATLLDYISEAARAQNIEVTWYRKDGHPVAIMRFQAELTVPTFQFVEVSLTEGKLRIQGRSTYGAAPDATPPAK
jgi:hypothetical protein